MNKTYIGIIILVLIVGFLFFVLKSKKSEAPVLMDQNQVGGTYNTNREMPATTTTSATTTTTEFEGIVAQ